MPKRIQFELNRDEAATVGLVLLARAQALESELAAAAQWADRAAMHRRRDEAHMLRRLAQDIATQLSTPTVPANNPEI